MGIITEMYRQMYYARRGKYRIAAWRFTSKQLRDLQRETSELSPFAYFQVRSAKDEAFGIKIKMVQ